MTSREVKPRRRGPLALLLSLLAVGTALFAAVPAPAAYVGNNVFLLFLDDIAVH